MKKKEAIQVIVNSAAKCIAGGDFTIRNMAKEAGLPTANIHYHMQHKDGIYQATIAHCRDRVAANNWGEGLSYIKTLIIHYAQIGDFEQLNHITNLYLSSRLKSA